MKFNLKPQYFMYVIAAYVMIAITACSNDPFSGSLGDFMSQTPTDQVSAVGRTTTDAAELKKAYVAFLKEWHIAKKDFDFSKIKDPQDRKNVKIAAEQVDKTLSALKSVRSGDVVNTAVVLRDLVMFRDNLRPAVAVLKDNLARHGSVTTPKRRSLYNSIVQHLEKITNNTFVNKLEPGDKLLKYLDILSTVGNLAKTLL